MYPGCKDFRDKSKSFDGMVAVSQVIGFGIATQPNELPRLTGGMFASANLFRVMGVEPSLGRGILPEEERVPGRDPVVVLGHDYWVKQFGGDPSAVGRRVRLNGIDFTVVGVAPQRFTGMDQWFRPAVFVPLMMWPRLAANAAHNPLDDRGDRGLMVKGRLKAGVSVGEARAARVARLACGSDARFALRIGRFAGTKRGLQNKLGAARIAKALMPAEPERRTGGEMFWYSPRNTRSRPVCPLVGAVWSGLASAPSSRESAERSGWRCLSPPDGRHWTAFVMI